MSYLSEIVQFLKKKRKENFWLVNTYNKLLCVALLFQFRRFRIGHILSASEIHSPPKLHQTHHPSFSFTCLPKSLPPLSHYCSVSDLSQVLISKVLQPRLFQFEHVLCTKPSLNICDHTIQIQKLNSAFTTLLSPSPKANKEPLLLIVYGRNVAAWGWRKQLREHLSKWSLVNLGLMLLSLEEPQSWKGLTIARIHMASFLEGHAAIIPIFLQSLGPGATFFMVFFSS